MRKIKELQLDIPNVTIIGRVNVGKSTLFNKLIEEDKAITSEISGTTRDRNTGVCRWGAHEFLLTDTAGIVPDQKDQDMFEKDIQKQIDLALKKSDLIFFTVDIAQGVVHEDRKIIDRLNKSQKPYFLILNKADSPKMRREAAEFYKLGKKELILISAKNGTGTADLLNKTTDILFKGKKQKTTKISTDLRIAIVGKPNVGKSSLLNAILGYEKCIVSHIAHTTREPQDTNIIYEKKLITLLDTAGIRRKYKYARELEKKSVSKGIDEIRKSDLCLFVLDASLPIEDHQDKKIAGQIIDPASSVLIIANKWDLAKEEMTTKAFEKQVRIHFPQIPWAPIMYVSAKTKQKVDKILDKSLELIEERNKEVDYGKLERILKRIIKKHKVSSKKHTVPYIYGIKQKEINPPKFELTVKKKEQMPEGLTKLIQKQIRKEFIFLGSPIFLTVKSIRQ